MDAKTQEVIANERRWHVQCSDVLDYLRSLPDGCVHCTCTSPPYYCLRDYGIPGQIGLEDTPRNYAEKLTEVFREVRRVLHDSGVCWINLGDSYAGGGANYCKGKDLIGIPWLAAFALREDGWYLRQRVVNTSTIKMLKGSRWRPSCMLRAIMIQGKFKERQNIKGGTASFVTVRPGCGEMSLAVTFGTGGCGIQKVFPRHTLPPSLHGCRPGVFALAPASMASVLFVPHRGVA